MSGENNGKGVMKMTEAPKPELVQLFENMLWSHTPKDWIVKTTYLQGTLFVSMLIKTSIDKQPQKIHRNFGIDVIHGRSTDIWGLAADCVDEMKKEIKQ